MVLLYRHLPYILPSKLYIHRLTMTTTSSTSLISNYVEALESLKRYVPVKLDLSNSNKLADLMGRPHRAYRVIHVAGTNGKGSTATKIKECLRLHGYRVGIFTSPHLCSFRERFQVNDAMITEEELVHQINLVWETAKANDLNMSFFEVCTQIAFNHFKEKSVEWAVIETGVGGRLDATNIVEEPRACVITSIGYDHMPILGTTLPEVANEKAGIIKRGCPVVLGPTASIYPAIWEKAKQMNCEVFEIKGDPRGLTFDDENRLVAEATLNEALKLDIPPYILEQGLKANPSLRFQKLSEADSAAALTYCKSAFKECDAVIESALSAVHTPPPIILDVGHNESGLERLCQDIGRFYFGKPIRICFSLSSEKSIEILNTFINHFSFPNNNRLMGLHFLPSLHNRSKSIDKYISEVSELEAPFDELKTYLLKGTEEGNRWITVGPFVDASTQLHNTEDVVQSEEIDDFRRVLSGALLQSTKESSLLLICGSFYFMKRALECLSFSIGHVDTIAVAEGPLIADKSTSNSM